MENTDALAALHRLKGATSVYLELLRELQPVFEEAARQEREAAQQNPPLWSPWLRVSDAIAEALREGADSVGMPAKLLQVVEDQLAHRSERAAAQ